MNKIVCIHRVILNEVAYCKVSGSPLPVVSCKDCDIYRPKGNILTYPIDRRIRLRRKENL